MKALNQVLEEKLVRRQVRSRLSIPARRRSVQGPGRQRTTLRAGISAEHGKRINKLVKDLGLKGVTSQVQGEQVRVTGKSVTTFKPSYRR